MGRKISDRSVSSRHFDVVLGTELQKGPLFIANGGDNFRGSTKCLHPGRNFRILGYETSGAQHHEFADLGPIQDHTTHSDQGKIANAAGMEHRRMSDRDVVADDRGMSLIGHVHNAIVLNVTSIAHPNVIYIPTQYGPKPNARIVANPNIAVNMTAGSAVRRTRNFRFVIPMRIKRFQLFQGRFEKVLARFYILGGRRHSIPLDLSRWLRLSPPE